MRRIILIFVLAAVAVVAAVTVVALAGKKTRRAPFVPTVLGAQPPGSVVLAQEDNDLAVALALKQQSSGSLLAVVTILDPDGTGASGLKTTVTVTAPGGKTVTSSAAAGTLGTYQALLRAVDPPVRASVTVVGAGSTNRPLHFVLPALWPPRPATALMQRVDRVYAGLTTLVIHERLASNPTNVVTTVYKAVAPSSLSIDSSNGTASIVIGDRRWDKVGTQWTESPRSPPIKVITPFWVGIVQDPTLLGSATVRGDAVSQVSFAAPQIPAFFQLDVDKRTGRVLDLDMTATAHFMHHTYGPFNAPLEITPPN